MNIINLVGKLNFETDLKGADKFLKIAKQCNEQAKELRKNFVKIGDDEVYSKLGERAKKLNTELKEMKAKGYASTKTMVLEGYLKTLQGKREGLKKAYRDIALAYDKKFLEYNIAGNKPALKLARLAKTQQYLTYRAKRGDLDDKIAEAQEELAGSKASDKATLQEMLGKKQGGIDVLTQAREDRKKEIKEENKLTGKKIENLKNEEKVNKQFAKDKKIVGRNALLALGKFTMALGIASGAVAVIANGLKKTTTYAQDYLGAESTGDIGTKGLQGMATALTSLGMKGKKSDITNILGKANWRANLRRYGQNMNAQNLAMADINPAEATTVTGLLQSAYRSFLSGVSPSLLANALSSEGLPAEQIIGAFKVAQSKGISDFGDFLSKSRSGATGEQNINWLRKAGIFMGAKNEVTGFGGEIWQNMMGTGMNPMDAIFKTLYDRDFMGVKSAGDVTINKTTNIYTNNDGVVKDVVGDDTESVILNINSGGY